MVSAVIELNAWPDACSGQSMNKYVSLSRAREEEFTDGVVPCAQHRSSGPTIKTLRTCSSNVLVLERS